MSIQNRVGQLSVADKKDVHLGLVNVSIKGLCPGIEWLGQMTEAPIC